MTKSVAKQVLLYTVVRCYVRVLLPDEWCILWFARCANGVPFGPAESCGRLLDFFAFIMCSQQSREEVTPDYGMCNSQLSCMPKHLPWAIQSRQHDLNPNRLGLVTPNSGLTAYLLLFFFRAVDEKQRGFFCSPRRHGLRYSKTCTTIKSSIINSPTSARFGAST